MRIDRDPFRVVTQKLKRVLPPKCAIRTQCVVDRTDKREVFYGIHRPTVRRQIHIVYDRPDGEDFGMIEEVRRDVLAFPLRRRFHCGSFQGAATDHLAVETARVTSFQGVACKVAIRFMKFRENPVDNLGINEGAIRCDTYDDIRLRFLSGFSVPIKYVFLDATDTTDPITFAPRNNGVIFGFFGRRNDRFIDERTAPDTFDGSLQH